MSEIANIEGRIKRIENLLKDETGAGLGSSSSGTSGTIRYPVRQLAITEEVSHNDDGVATSTAYITWKSPAGSAVPDEIKLTINSETVTLGGQETSYRKTGFAAGDTVKVVAVAAYSFGNSSAVVAQLTMTGNGEAPQTPSGFTAVGGFCTITLRWNIPSDTNFSHMEVWESVIYDNLESAERIAQAYGSEFVRSNCGVLETRWYWIRAVDTGGNKGEFTGPVVATTTAIQPSEIPDGTIQESHLIGDLAQKINDSNAAIEVIESVRTGDINVFTQATAPTEGMQTGDLWIDNNEAVWRYIGGQWDLQQDTTVYDLLKAAIVQYTVKTQTMADGKLKVAGFGLFNDSSTGSEFAILADRFYIYGQSADGTYTNVQVFTVDTTQSPPVVGINGNLIVDGTITGDKIFAGSRIQLSDGGQLIMGDGSIFQMGSGAIIIDSETGVLQIRDPNNLTTGNYIRVEVGDITTYQYIAGAYRAMKSLRKMEVGTGSNGTTVTLPGYWPSQPKIQVSPNALQCYNTSYSNQNQQLRCYADAITYNSGVVTFVPRAYLEIAAGGNNVPLPVPAVNVSLWGSNRLEIPGTFNTSVYTSVPSGARNIVITAKVYVQRCVSTTSGANNYVTYRTTKMTVTAYVGGVAYTVGSATFSPAVNDISSEPTSLYRTLSITVPSGSGSVYLAAYVENPSGAVSQNFNSGNPLNCSKAWLRFDSLQYSLSGSTQLATGTLNYVAIAE